MLNRSGYSNRDVKVRGDNLAGLTNLHFIRHVTGINCRTRGADSGAQLVSQRINYLEILGTRERAASGNDLRGSLQVWTVAGTCLHADKSGVRGKLSIG